jgi:hypothetical protein
VHLTTIAATRYVQPLREGGSLPAVVDTEAGLFVVKFRGAGQGPKALIAELIVGGIAKALGLGMPELALIEIDDLFGQSEPDPEIQDVLRASHGTNVGLRYLDGAFNFALAASGDLVEPEWAARVVWLDAFLTNPDRTHRNTNLMVWDRRVWLIDHGAALYAHHDWARVDEARARSPFPLIRDHVLLGVAGDLEATDAVEADVTAPELATAEEVFLTSTAGGILPVTRIDHRPVGDGETGPVSARLRTLYWQRHDEGWQSTPVEYDD